MAVEAPRARLILRTAGCGTEGENINSGAGNTTLTSDRVAMEAGG